jgi:hypothetical protein
VIAIDPQGGQQTRLLKGGSSYASTSDHRLLFGFGASQSPRQLEIHWPSGVVQRLTVNGLDRYLEVVESGSLQIPDKQ